MLTGSLCGGVIVSAQGRRSETVPLRMSVDPSNRDAPVITVGGDLIYTSAAPLQAEVDRMLADTPALLVLDFAALEFIDSTGLGVIVHAWREGQQSGTALELRAVPRFLATILDMTGVAGLLARPLGDPHPDAAAHPARQG